MSTIKDDVKIADLAFKICKEIKTKPNFSEMRTLLSSFSATQPAGTQRQEDRHHFGAWAQRQDCQFLGYLIVNQRRDDILNSARPQLSGLTLYELSERDKTLLYSANVSLQKLYAKCLSDLSPKIQKACDPFFKYETVVGRSSDELEILTENDIEQLAASFQLTHPAYKVARETLPDSLEKAHPDQLAEHIHEFTLMLGRQSLESTPSDITDLIYKERRDSEKFRNFRARAAMASMLRSLKQLSQLFYQAFLTDKLFLFDQECVINAQTFGGLVKKGYLIRATMAKDILFVRTSDLVLYKNESTIVPKTCYVHQISMQASEDFGMGFNFELVSVDKTLSPFNGIVFPAR